MDKKYKQKSKILSMQKIKIVGISGFSGSGKTTLAKHLYEHFAGKSVSLSIDNFYKPVSEHPLINAFRNHEVLDSFDLETLKKTLICLKLGENVKIPIFNKQKGIGDNILELTVKPIIFVEGILLFNNPEIYNLIDLRIWLNIDLKTQKLRLKARLNDFNQDYYNQIIKPSQELIYQSASKKADYLVDSDKIEINKIIQKICLI